MTARSERHGAPDSIEVAIKYLANDEDLAVYVPSVGGGDVTDHQGNYVMQPVAVHNARLWPGDFDIDREGFTLVEQESAIEDFYDDNAITRIYEAEVKALVLSVTGARRVEIFDHTRRAAATKVQQARTVREPASIVHNDYTARSGPNRLRDHLAESPDEAEALLARRFAIVNVWRSIRGTVRNAPLALCDASSVAPGDLISVERRARERIGEIQLAVHSPCHRWFYFPEMRPDEALLLKTYDSATDGRARFTIHTSFDDPNAATDAPSRESIETRCFVFF